MIRAVPFQTRARTIDHLGREQIADCPTAISELWKNSYDAYARNVSLSIFCEDVPIAAVSDDGHGMSEQEFLDRWLVVGTDSKLGASATPVVDRRGLKERARQGQKGIGRLSCAALGPMALIVSKRRTEPFVAALLDWRLFRNPFLLLHDIEIPVVSFNDKKDLLPNIDGMADKLVANVWGTSHEADKSKRIEKAWNAFDELEKRQGNPSTREAVASTIIKTAFDERHLSSWPVWNGAAETGTLLLVADVVFDLQALAATDAQSEHDDLIQDARERVFRTLSSFVDPFVDPKTVNDKFHYRIESIRVDRTSTFLSDKREFDFSTFEELEHIVDGTVDAEGVFHGRVKAFGKLLEEHVVIKPKLAKRPAGVQWKLGSFSFRAGAYEASRVNSALDDAAFARIDEQAARYGGLFLFRDGLRVLPFGRPDNDFFEIERRRTGSAGREFWSYRRMFGSIGITASGNPNLRDKAGREGLIDNESAKIFRQIVEGILRESAYQYFGSRSEIRAEQLEGIRAQNRSRKAKEEQRRLAKKRRDAFRTKVRSQLEPLKECYTELQGLRRLWAAESPPKSEKGILARRSALDAIERNLRNLDVGEPPAGLQSFEESYGEYINFYRKSVRLAGELSNDIYKILDALLSLDPRTVFEQERVKRQRELESLVSRRLNEISALHAHVDENIRQIGRHQVSDYVSQINLIYREVLERRLALSPGLRRLDEKFVLSRDETDSLFESIVITFESLRDNIDLNAVAYSGLDDLAQLREELSKVNALAQLGITVEIIGHELETLDASVTRGLAAFAKDVRSSAAFHTVSNAYQALTERLQFLSPLKLSGEQEKEWITGREIDQHLKEFFGEIFEREKIALSSSREFAKFRVYDRRARIFPVFVNLSNNSRYWIAQKSQQGGQIKLAMRGEKVIFGDDGPGVAEDDVKNLFTLFFTRKPRGGRGVGLYLCRTNLAAGGHRIRYSESQDEDVLSGANFVMEFLGAEYE